MPSLPPIGFTTSYTVGSRVFPTAWIQAKGIKIYDNIVDTRKAEIYFDVYLNLNAYNTDKKPIVKDVYLNYAGNSTQYTTFLANNVCDITQQVCALIPNLPDTFMTNVIPNLDGFTCDWVDENGTGIEYIGAWTQYLSCNFVFQNFVTFFYNIYENNASYLNGDSPVTFEPPPVIGIVTNDPNWDLYFQNTVCNIEAQTILLLQNVLGIIG